MNRFPWDDAMAFGLGVLRLPPSDFWTMTPRELAAAWRAVAGAAGAEPMRRQGLDTLMGRYPDGDGNGR